MSTAPLFPMFLKLEGRSCLVLGAGSIGEGKVRGLLDCGARVRVVAPEVSSAVRGWAERGELTWTAKSYEPADLDGIFLVVAATSDIAVNHAIYRDAQARGILCNVVDDPPHCDFYYPAIVRRGQLQIAISTAGLSPSLAQRIRKQLEEEFPVAYGGWLESLGQQRDLLFRQGGDPEARRKRLHEIATNDAFLKFQKVKVPSAVEHERKDAQEARNLSVAPPGLATTSQLTHGLRRGLHSDAAPRLKQSSQYESGKEAL